VFATGTAAQLALAETPGVSVVNIQTHENAAFAALGFMELTGAVAWFGLWQYRRRSHVPQKTLAAVLVLGVVSFGLMSRAANIGGEIRHEELRTVPAPVESVVPPLTRVIGSAMVNQKWYWPLCETLHFIGLCLLMGVVLVVDLRMLGLLKGISYAALHRLLPWGVAGFAVNLATGMLFFIGAPPDFYISNSVFLWKIALILVAGANALYFTIFDQAWAMGAGDAPPMGAKVAAASGIVLWVGVIICGQMLPFLGNAF
jgi:uncharacterized membrane protein